MAVTPLQEKVYHAGIGKSIFSRRDFYSIFDAPEHRKVRPAGSPPAERTLFCSK
jgi:hypothetical protein